MYICGGACMGYSMHSEVRTLWELVLPSRTVPWAQAQTSRVCRSTFTCWATFLDLSFTFWNWFYLFSCMCVYLCMCVCTLECGCPPRPEEGINALDSVPSNLMWVLGTECRSSAGVASTLNHWAISPAPSIFFITTGIYNPKCYQTTALEYVLSLLHLLF